MSLKCATVLAVLFAVVVHAGSAAAETILVYGDSLSAAYGLATREGWPSLLQERLRDQKFNYAVVNASISGETSAGGASRIRTELSATRPAVIILELGANDGLRGLPVAEMTANLERIISASEAAKARVLLIGMQMPPNYGPRYTASFAQAFAELAARHKLPFVPFMLAGFAEERDLFQADGLHPIAAAEPRIVDNIWPTLEPMLRH